MIRLLKYCLFKLRKIRYKKTFLYSDETFFLLAINRIIQGIDYLHSNKLVHRDLKPTNIHIDHDFIPNISDFDAIRHPKEEEDVSLDPMSYMSPEQFKGKNVSYPIDIYSFGLIFYYLYEKKILYITKKDDITVLNGASSII